MKNALDLDILNLIKIVDSSSSKIGLLFLFDSFRMQLVQWMYYTPTYGQILCGFNTNIIKLLYINDEHVLNKDVDLEFDCI